MKNLSGHRFKDDVWFSHISNIFTNNFVSFSIVNAIFNLTRNLDTVRFIQKIEYYKFIIQRFFCLILIFSFFFFFFNTYWQVEYLKLKCLEKKDSNGLISRDTLFSEALKSGSTINFSPLELDILYKLCSSIEQQTTKLSGLLSPSTFDKLIFPSFGVTVEDKTSHYHKKTGVEEALTGYNLTYS